MGVGREQQSNKMGKERERERERIMDQTSQSGLK